MPQLYENPDHEALHTKAMKSLALETGHAFSVVKQVYEVELSRLQAGAHLKDYLLLLSSRRTRESLRGLAKADRAEALTA
jgi:hypothetical protein